MERKSSIHEHPVRVRRNTWMEALRPIVVLTCCLPHLLHGPSVLWSHLSRPSRGLTRLIENLILLAHITGTSQRFRVFSAHWMFCLIILHASVLSLTFIFHPLHPTNTVTFVIFIRHPHLVIHLTSYSHRKCRCWPEAIVSWTELIHHRFGYSQVNRCGRCV